MDQGKNSALAVDSGVRIVGCIPWCAWLISQASGLDWNEKVIEDRQFGFLKLANLFCLYLCFWSWWACARL